MLLAETRLFEADSSSANPPRCFGEVPGEPPEIVSSEHVFTSRLLMSNGTAFPNQPVKLFFNDTQVTTLATNGSGFIEFRRHFDPGNESDTYNVQVTYDGSGGQSATQN